MLTPILLATLVSTSPASTLTQGTPAGEQGASAESPFNEVYTNSSWDLGGLEPGSEDTANPGPIKNPSAAKAAARACAWLAAQQNEDGSWSPAGSGPSPMTGKGAAASKLSDEEFWKRALDGSPAKAAPAKAPAMGDPLHSIGVTGLAVMALVADGSTMTRGRNSDQVVAAVKYLLSQQDWESGLIGDPIGHAYHYDHAIATLALARVYSNDRSATLASKVTAAVDYIARARNPYRVWRYDNPPTGENDSSVTAWMTLALAEADRAKLKVDREAFPAVIEWFREMAEEGTGRIGYTERGSKSSRVFGLNVEFATDPETLTAAGLVSLLACGQTPRKNAALVDHVRCILQALPSEKDPKLTDTLWFYFGTMALHDIGSRPWESWSKAMLPLVLAAQNADGSTAGSFDPQAVAWGFSTGRVGTTALTAAALHTASQ